MLVIQFHIWRLWKKSLSYNFDLKKKNFFLPIRSFWRFLVIKKWSPLVVVASVILKFFRQSQIAFKIFTFRNACSIVKVNKCVAWYSLKNSRARKVHKRWSSRVQKKRILEELNHSIAENTSEVRRDNSLPPSRNLGSYLYETHRANARDDLTRVCKNPDT